MANLPADFKNLSPFAGSKKAKGGAAKGNPALLALGMLGVLAAIALVFCALTLKAG